MREDHEFRTTLSYLASSRAAWAIQQIYIFIYITKYIYKTKSPKSCWVAFKCQERLCIQLGDKGPPTVFLRLCMLQYQLVDKRYLLVQQYHDTRGTMISDESEVLSIEVSSTVVLVEAHNQRGHWHRTYYCCFIKWTCYQTASYLCLYP